MQHDVAPEEGRQYHVLGTAIPIEHLEKTILVTNKYARENTERSMQINEYVCTNKQNEFKIHCFLLNENMKVYIELSSKSLYHQSNNEFMKME